MPEYATEKGHVHFHAVHVMRLFFFFQAEDGIRDVAVTGVQTCALPIYLPHGASGSSLMRLATPAKARPAKTELIILFRVSGQLFAISSASVQEVRSADRDRKSVV